MHNQMKLLLHALAPHCTIYVFPDHIFPHILNKHLHHLRHHLQQKFMLSQQWTLKVQAYEIRQSGRYILLFWSNFLSLPSQSMMFILHIGAAHFSQMLVCIYKVPCHYNPQVHRPQPSSSFRTGPRLITNPSTNNNTVTTCTNTTPSNAVFPFHLLFINSTQSF